MVTCFQIPTTFWASKRTTSLLLNVHSVRCVTNSVAWLCRLSAKLVPTFADRGTHIEMWPEYLVLVLLRLKLLLRSWKVEIKSRHNGFNQEEQRSLKYQSISWWSYSGSSASVLTNWWTTDQIFCIRQKLERKIGVHSACTLAIHRYKESLWFGEEWSIVQHAHRVWDTHEAD
jgi:hypothetical protein